MGTHQSNRGISLAQILSVGLRPLPQTPPISCSQSLQCLGLLVRGESRLATEFDTTRSCLDTPCGGALGDALPLPTGCDPQHRDYYLCKLGSRINHRLGQFSEASPGLLHCMEAIHRSEESLVGNGCDSTCISRWLPY